MNRQKRVYGVGSKIGLGRVTTHLSDIVRWHLSDIFIYPLSDIFK